jgi:hypothetical protein
LENSRKFGIEKWSDEIGRIGRLKKRNEDGEKSTKVEDGIGNVGRDCGRQMTGSRNVKADG